MFEQLLPSMLQSNSPSSPYSMLSTMGLSYPFGMVMVRRSSWLATAPAVATMKRPRGKHAPGPKFRLILPVLSSNLRNFEQLYYSTRAWEQTAPTPPSPSMSCTPRRALAVDVPHGHPYMHALHAYMRACMHACMHPSMTYMHNKHDIHTHTTFAYIHTLRHPHTLHICMHALHYMHALHIHT